MSDWESGCIVCERQPAEFRVTVRWPSGPEIGFYCRSCGGDVVEANLGGVVCRPVGGWTACDVCFFEPADRVVVHDGGRRRAASCRRCADHIVARLDGICVDELTDVDRAAARRDPPDPRQVADRVAGLYVELLGRARDGAVVRADIGAAWTELAATDMPAVAMAWADEITGTWPAGGAVGWHARDLDGRLLEAVDTPAAVRALFGLLVAYRNGGRVAALDVLEAHQADPLAYAALYRTLAEHVARQRHEQRAARQ